MDDKLQKRLKLILDGYAHKLLSVEDAVIMLHEIFKNDDHKASKRAVNNIENDPVFGEVLSYVRESGKASTSDIQIKFKIGYGRASRIIAQLEEDGIISSAPEGGGARTVY